MQQFVHSPKCGDSGDSVGSARGRRRRPRTVAVAVASVGIGLALTGCGGSARRAPTPRDVTTVAAAMSDIAYQCQSVAAGYVASADASSLQRDVDALLDAYRRVRPDAPLVIGPLRTTLRRELRLAELNVRSAGCSAAQERRITAVLDGRWPAS